MLCHYKYLWYFTTLVAYFLSFQYTTNINQHCHTLQIVYDNALNNTVWEILCICWRCLRLTFRSRTVEFGRVKKTNIIISKSSRKKPVTLWSGVAHSQLTWVWYCYQHQNITKYCYGIFFRLMWCDILLVLSYMLSLYVNDFLSIFCN